MAVLDVSVFVKYNVSDVLDPVLELVCLVRDHVWALVLVLVQICAQRQVKDVIK